MSVSGAQSLPRAKNLLHIWDGAHTHIIRASPEYPLQTACACASHASTKPVNQRGMPVKFLRTIVAICPPFSPHQREKTAVNALAPTSVNPVIMKNITAPIPAVPRYKTDRDATVKAIKR